MMTNNKWAVNNLLAMSNRKAFMTLHNTFAMNFEDEFFITEQYGNFTHGSVIKLFEQLTKDNWISNYNVFILYEPEEKWNTTLRLVQVKSTCFLITRDEIGCRTLGMSDGMETNWRKADFEKHRKNKEIHWFMIIQHKDKTMHRVYKDGITQFSRLKIVDVDHYVYSAGSKNEYIGTIRVKLNDRPNDGRWKINREWNDDITPDNINRIIDKSGYLVVRRQAEYRRRITEIRVNKSKQQAIEYDNTNDIKEIEKRIEKLHNTIRIYMNGNIEEVFKNYQKIDKIVGFLDWIKNDVKKFQNHTYETMEQIDSDLSHIKYYLDKAEAVVNVDNK